MFYHHYVLAILNNVSLPPYFTLVRSVASLALDVELGYVLFL